jgi:hypothetical protein
MMKEWARAGVEGGIPALKKNKIIKQISPQNNLQSAIDEVAKKGGGVLLLTKGEYVIRKTILLQSNVIVRGTRKEDVLLSVKLHGYHFSTKKPTQSALCAKKKQKIGIENLTIKYTDAPFEPLDRDSMNAPWTKEVFHEKELRDTSLFVEMIWLDSSKNCWVDNCAVLWSGSDPIRITNSSHITCSRNTIDRSYNKNDGGMGYYNLINSIYVLIHHEHIRRIRHFAIQNHSKYNVVVQNYLEVDINFHNGDDGYNLVENNTIRIPQWHSWHCFSHGDYSQHSPPGKWDILFNNDAIHKTGVAESSERGIVYIMNDSTKGPGVIRTTMVPPRGNTFYIGKYL